MRTVTLSPTQRAVLHQLQLTPGQTAAELAEPIGRGVCTVRVAVRQLVSDMLVYRVGGGLQLVEYRALRGRVGMTTYRHPYDRNKQPDRVTRPPIPEWLDRPSHVVTRMQQHTVDYWLGMYWAAPPWLTDEHIQQLLDWWAPTNPDFEHLDHIVPLHHELVCGLHVPWNIQRLPWRENLSKSNHYWPDCPEHLCPIKNLPVDMFGHNAPHQMGLGL